MVCFAGNHWPGGRKEDYVVFSSQSALAGKTPRIAGAVLALALTLCSILPGAAHVRILASGGGAVGDYLNFFAKVKQSGERVVIDGPCLSACTLVLSTIRASGSVSPRGVESVELAALQQDDLLAQSAIFF